MSIRNTLPPIPINADVADFDAVSYTKQAVEQTPNYSNNRPSNYPTYTENTPYSGGYGQSGRLGPSDVSSIVANSPLIAVTSGISSGAMALAQQFEPSGSLVAMGVVGWLTPFLIALLLKVIASVIRNNGESWLRNVGSKLWYKIYTSKQKANLCGGAVDHITEMSFKIPIYTIGLLVFGTALWITLESFTTIGMPWLVLIVFAIAGFSIDLVRNKV